MREVEERLTFGEVELTVARPADPAALVDEERFARDEYLPYWAEVWPAGRALAHHVARRSVAGVRILELGCGLGLPSLVAAARGAFVTAIDWSPEAIACLERNARRNGLDLDAAVVDWVEADALVGHELVLASDVLYEERNARPVAEVVARLVAAGAIAVVADPGRRHAATFAELLEDLGLEVRLLAHDLQTMDAWVVEVRAGR